VTIDTRIPVFINILTLGNKKIVDLLVKRIDHRIPIGKILY